MTPKTQLLTIRCVVAAPVAQLHAAVTRLRAKLDAWPPGMPRSLQRGVGFINAGIPPGHTNTNQP